MASYPLFNNTFHELGRFDEEWGYRGRNGQLYFGARAIPFGGKMISRIGDRVILQYDTETKELKVFVKQVGETEYSLSGGKVAFTNVAPSEGRKLRFVAAGICYLDCGVKIVSSSIPKKTQEISFPPFVNKIYGDSNFEPEARSDSGFEVSYSSDNTNVATIVADKVQIIGAGTANITATQEGNGIYVAAEAKTQMLTVSKNALSITAENKIMKQGEVLPTFTASYSGFVNEEDESVFTVNPVFNTEATSLSEPGSYDIEVSGATAANYSISYYKGILTVEEGTLPVTLIDFTAKAANNHVLLNWQTSSESNNKEYIISRSTGGIQFIELGRIPGKGNSNGIVDYSYSDKNPLTGNNYYKLVQVDDNGNETDLGIRTVNFRLSALDIQLYPNPTNDEVNITFEPGNYHTVTLVDLSGKVLQQIQIKRDEISKALFLGNYAPGTYLIKLTGDKEIALRKVVRK